MVVSLLWWLALAGLALLAHGAAAILAQAFFLIRCSV